LGFVAAQIFFDLQADAGLMLLSQHAPKLCLCGHNFIWASRAKASKNTCDFAEYNPDGDLQYKSSHAADKTASLFALYYRFAI